ncbi:hypothetical protein AB6A40_008512 [Gnathostoma spinigerum]|uniref:RING-type E3 ubiquitin transferase n=1 Tax=Gnathostoma spinigerum TaxID=75299 RepID=A0ABD6EPB6_9BILA
MDDNNVVVIELDSSGTGLGQELLESRYQRVIVDGSQMSDDNVVTPDTNTEITTEAGTSTNRRAIQSSSDEENCKDKKVRKKRTKIGSPEKSTTEVAEEDEETNSCLICFEGYNNCGSHRLVSLKCGHLFGQSCIEKWIRSERYAKCPSCKTRAKLGDVRRIFARNIKMFDTTELENLKESLSCYKAENESLRLEVSILQAKLKTAQEMIETLSKQSEPVINQRIGNLLPKRLRIMINAGPVVPLSSEAKSIDANSDMIVVTYRLKNDVFLPYLYGLQVLSPNGSVQISIPIHTKKPRCCSISPFQPSTVLSTGEDQTLCVTDVVNSRVLYRFQLTANGWCCCWTSEAKVAVGCQNGRVFQFNLGSDELPSDLTGGYGRMPITHLYYIRYCLFVVSLKECIAYRHYQSYPIVKNEGSICSFVWNDGSDSFMVAFSPNEKSEAVIYALHEVDLTTLEVLRVTKFNIGSHVQTRMIHSTLWNVNSSLIMAIFDEQRSQIYLHDWYQCYEDVANRVNDAILAVKHVATDKPDIFILVCLSERQMTFLNIFF